MGGKGSAPPAPDYAGAAAQQAAGSKEVTTQQTWANRPTQVTPLGTINWTPQAQIDPATGQSVTSWTQNVQLTPGQQEALDAQQRLGLQRSGLAESMFGNVSQEMGTPMDWSKYGTPQGLQGTSAEAQQKGIDTYMQNYSRNADPMNARAEDQLRTRLANQGLSEDSSAYRQAMSDFDKQKNLAFQNATSAAILQGQQAGAQAQGMDVQAATFANQNRQQQIAEDMQRRGFSLNEINALMSGQQVGLPNQPSFSNAGASQGADALGAAQLSGNAALDAYNAQQAKAGQTMSTVGQVAGMAGMIAL